MNHWLERTQLLVGDDNLQRLKQAKVLIVGLGGVGAYAAEMICRAGVQHLTIVDADVVNHSNRNRQLLALTSTIGQPKARIMEQRLLDINPEASIRVVESFVVDTELDELLNEHYDYVVDAIDTLQPKINLIVKCLERGLRLVSSMGAGGKFAPTLIEVADIKKSHHCPLAHSLRRRLHSLGIKSGFMVVFSPEIVDKSAVALCNERNKKSNVGTISYMPAVFGCTCASVVIRTLLQEPA